MSININDPDQIKKDLKDLADKIIEASLLWNSDDEEKNPALRTARTLAGIFKDRYNLAEI